MNRSQLEHIIRAASGVANVEELIVIGSQSILGQFPHAPPSLTLSIEADVYPKFKPEDSIVIDGAIGELSIFHQSHGYYAHGVGADTAVLPRGWEERLVAIKNENTHGATGWCLEAHDLAASKLVAGREKDHKFVANLFRYRMISSDLLMARVEAIDFPDDSLKKITLDRLGSIINTVDILPLPEIEIVGQ